MKKILALLLACAMLLVMFAGCGNSAASTAAASEAEETAESAAPAEETAEAAETAEEAPADETAPAEEAASTAEAEEPAEEETGVIDNTEANFNNDFTAHQELLASLHTELPVTDEDVTLTYFMGVETETLNYMPDNDYTQHQVWQWINENTGVNIELTLVEKTNIADKYNLMIASGDYTDLMTTDNYTTGIETAYEDEVVEDLTDLIPEYMPNYWTIINSDQNILADVTDADMLLKVYPIKNQIANPSGKGTFIRMDWLEALDLEVPQTYDELTEVLTAFKNEYDCEEPMALFNTVNESNGLLMGGFGSIAELSTNGMGTDWSASFYQVDGEVIYGATQDGTRKFLSWLHSLYEQNLINFENMQNRDVNPFGELNATKAADGSTGYIFSNQPFGGNYSTMAADQYGDTECNWWPVQDVAEEAGATIPFYEENSLVDTTGASSISISTQCEDIEAALAFLDFGYSYEGALIYNFGFEIGSGEGLYETWSYDGDKPMFDAAAIKEVADTTNIASSIISTKDLAGVIYDDRLNFEFGERENACISAWSTNKNTSQILGSDVTLTAEENTDASAIYSDIITYVGTSALQFINGDLDIDSDADWNSYVEKIEAMNIDGLTEIIQAAYDRVN